MFETGALVHAIKISDIKYLIDFGLLRPQAEALDYIQYSNSLIKHLPIASEDWFSGWLQSSTRQEIFTGLRDLDFYPVFPSKALPILLRLLDMNIRTLRRLSLPNFVKFEDLNLKRFEFHSLRKCFMTYLIQHLPERSSTEFDRTYFSFSHSVVSPLF